MNIAHRIALALVLTALAAAPVAAQEVDVPTPTENPGPVKAEVPTQTPRERIVFLLSGYEYFPTRADLDAVAPAKEVAGLLREMAANVDERPSLRLRAVDALGFYDDPDTVGMLTRIVTEEPKADLPRRKLRTAGLLRHHAITALARSQGPKAVPILETIFASNDTQLTLTVVDALGKHGSKEGREALTRLLSESQDKIVRREAARWVK